MILYDPKDGPRMIHLDIEASEIDSDDTLADVKRFLDMCSTALPSIRVMDGGVELISRPDARPFLCDLVFGIQATGANPVELFVDMLKMRVKLAREENQG